jgi:hypothetical protein
MKPLIIKQGNWLTEFSDYIVSRRVMIVSQKRRLTFNGLQGGIPQKTEIFTTTGERTLNPSTGRTILTAFRPVVKPLPTQNNIT